MPFARASALHIQETFQILFAIPRVEGWRALFKGLGPNLIGVVPARSINFYTYGNLKKLFSNTFNNGQEGALVQGPAAICAGLVTGTATNPIWVIKTRLQLDRANAGSSGGRKYSGVIDCTMKTIKYEGIRGLYRGLSASFLGVSESTMHWILYEQGKAYLRKREAQRLVEQRTKTTWDDLVKRFGETFFAGGAKLVATAVTYPHEVRFLIMGFGTWTNER
jgi:solute carrier family 25 protein 33/36